MRISSPAVALSLLVLLASAISGKTLAADEMRDLAYGPDPAQKLDVYRAKASIPAPIILMIHGGAWMFGDRQAQGVVAEKVAHWQPRGYLFVSAGYRFAEIIDPVEQARDVGRALAYVQKNARGWGGDPRRIVLMGHSAGAHLVTLLGANATLARETGAQPWLGTVALDSAAYDVAAIMARPHAALYDRAFGADPALWRRASPIHAIDGKPAPMLLVCSSLREVSCPASDDFARALTRAGARAEVLPVALRHAPINRQLGKPGAYTERVDAFLRSIGLT